MVGTSRQTKRAFRFGKRKRSDALLGCTGEKDRNNNTD